MGLVRDLKREMRTFRLLAKTGLRMRAVRLDSDWTVADALEAVIDRRPGAVAIYWGDRQVTYAELEATANRVASWARSEGIGPGTVVGLLMGNRPEFIATWFGLAKVGAQTALINTNLRTGPLAHAIGIAEAETLILGAELADAYESARGSLARPPVVWMQGGVVPGARDFEAALAAASASRPDRALRSAVRARDNLFFIYTSGTTGNPKAAYFSHARFLQVGAAYSALVEITAADRVYCVLPLYHTAGGVVASSMALLEGATLILRDKFSASRFWEDCRRYQVTVFQYIGELCRYLLAAPPGVDDRSHAVRCAVGNGLRPDIWERFQERFRIPRILEFYGATEGNVALINVDGKVGAIGRIPPYARRFFPVKLVRYDVAADSHVRGPDGFCMECRPDEVGEAIGKLPQSEREPVARFEGYRDASASEKKILRGVFAPGDAWFRTGDLLRCDRAGYYYFVDRIGDTFRWKGENVATSEVAEVLSTAPGVQEANVYGVQVPGHDGRAGMAAVVSQDGLDVRSLYQHVSAHLPAYARPLFLRLTSRMETTVTFKHRKVDLAEQGFDPARVDDALYFRDDAVRDYVRLDGALYERLCRGDMKI